MFLRSASVSLLALALAVPLFAAEAAADAAAVWVGEHLASLVTLTDNHVGEVGMSSRGQ